MKRLHPTTLSPVMTQDFLSDDYSDSDLFLRVRSEKEYKTFTITSINTQTVRDGLNAYFVQHSQDIDLLCSVIFWQKRTIDYQALHTAFLLDSLSEEGFEQEAEKFTVHQKNIPSEKVASIIERLDSLIGIKLDTSDYSDYFQCSQENVMDGLRLLPAQRFAAMLPASSEK
ncbi:hypothetical protein CRENPOLYSF2_2080004 [Crenothrix polyspora]|jgi:hypothetical protein|uniref:Uncharacterized protein n=1 Tax=Crenothrix polyspora TaxID=360316 RepID=A0A1R4H4G7_9GAMM|nr:hypothetical protein [Crenothrix polyspora]SJM91153.1 hypothetical protein CRENPOLYSF2_2080004 [Crenothrix polyspora]